MTDSAECFVYKGSNFKMWKKLLTNILKAKDLSYYVTSNIFNEADKNDKNFREIDKNNSKVVAIIIKSVDESFYKDIEDLESAYDMIKKLEEINQKEDELIVKKLIKRLATMKPLNYMEVLKCLSDMLNIFNKLKNANYYISENDKIQYMFKVLPKELQIDFLPEPGKTAENYYDFIKSRNIFTGCMNERKILKPQNNYNHNYNYNDPMDLDLVFNKSYIDKSHRKNNFQRKRNPYKYCHICSQQGHLTDECYYNGRTNGTMNQSKFNNKK